MMHHRVTLGCMCRFGGLLHDWPESYFKAQQSRGGGLAGVFKQAMDQHQAGKITRSRNILARMFPNSPLARLNATKVCTCQGGGGRGEGC